MNEYKITYTVNGKTYTTNRVERTEATARRAFLKNCKEVDTIAEVTDIELIRDDACATKQQERDTLEAIKKLVAELGPQSYLATAFEGCFEDAEANIENDFGDSYKRRCESLERKLDEADAEIESLREKLAESEKDYEAAHAAAHAVAEEKDAEIKALRSQVLTPDDLEDVRQLLDDRATEADERAEKAAARIVELAEATALPEFKQAVVDHRDARRDAEYTRKLLGRVVACCPRGVSI